MTQPVFSIDAVSFAYESSREGAGIVDISLSARPGEVVLLVGESGSGKTSVTKLVNGLIPHYYPGRLSGEVEVLGRSVPDAELYEVSQHVGSVFQNPRSQFFTTDTTSELAFSCENQGIDKQEILSRIRHVADDLKVEPLLGRSIFQLSGGERQSIACAAASTIVPDIYVLDEPSSNLDMAAIEQLGYAIGKWKTAGKTVLIAEHRIFYVRDLVDRVVFMKEGRIEKSFTGDDLRSMSNEELYAMGLRAAVLQERGTASEASSKRFAKHAPCATEPEVQDCVCIEGMRYSYQDKPVLAIDRLEIPRHGITALIGRNGAGKSTFSLCLAGLMKKNKATLTIDGVRYRGRKLADVSYMVMQDVNHQLFTEDVIGEVLLSMSDPSEDRARGILSSLNLLQFEDRHPLSLSGGQKQRVAIASALASDRKLLIYDEPTSGLDLRHMKEVAQVVEKMRQASMTQIVVTHDPEFIETCCTHVVEMDAGCVSESYALDEEGIRRMYAFFRQFSHQASGGAEA